MGKEENTSEKTVTIKEWKPSDEFSMPPTPEKIGDYKIESILSRGGMSILYLAKHPKTSETVVIKVVSPKYLKSKEMMSRLLREAKIIGMSSHPSIAKLYDLGQWENGLFVAMEYIKGISLRQFIKEKSLTHKRALEIILQIAYGLAHLHSQGVVHRDLKPENILMTESGEIKLIDFGISQFMEFPEDFDRITKKKGRMGTPGYMSPEQRDDPNHISYPTDIFSLGIIAYELYLGKLSYGIVHLALLPKGFRKIVEKAVQTSPEKRYGDIVDFIADVSAYLKSIDEKKEDLQEEVSEEMLDLIQNVSKILLPTVSPKWAEFNIGIAIREGSLANSLYLDFFALEQNQFGVILAEPYGKYKADSIAPAVMLRGMIRTAVLEKDFQLSRFIARIGRMLHDDPMGERFCLAFLLLLPEKNRLSFLSCGGGNVVHYPAMNALPKLLETQNPPLGSEIAPSLSELEDQWTPESILLFSSFEQTAKNERLISVLAPQQLSEAAINQALTHHSKKTSALVAIQKI